MPIFNEFLKIREILESASHYPFHQESLRYKLNDLQPAISQKLLDVHYNKLAKGYVDRFNNGEGDSNFNYGGAKLHEIYFAQFHEPNGSNLPSGRALEIINDRYENFTNLQNKIVSVAMGIQGSGWIYVDTSGEIRTIKNHEYKEGLKIMLLIDFWEHAWFLDYLSDKKKYLQNIWGIIAWNIINTRLGT